MSRETLLKHINQILLSIAAEYPALATKSETVTDGTYRLKVSNEAVAPGISNPVHPPTLRIAFNENGYFLTEKRNHPDTWEFDHDAFRDALASGDMTGIERTFRNGLGSLMVAEVPRRYRTRSVVTFIDVIVEKGSDGLYRWRPATPADDVERSGDTKGLAVAS